MNTNEREQKTNTTEDLLDTPTEEVGAQTSTSAQTNMSDLLLEEGGLDENYAKQAGTTKEATSYRIEKPGKRWFNPSPKKEHQLRVAILEDPDTKAQHVVAKNMQTDLAGDWVAKILQLCRTDNGDYFWWAVKRHLEDGNLDTWNESAHEILADRQGKWIKLKANLPMKRYDVTVSDKEPPQWDDVQIDEIVSKTMKGKVVIRDDSHEVVHKVRGR